MDTNQARQVIRKLRFMSSLSAEARDKVADIFVEVSEQRSVPEGGVFIHEHEHVDDRGFILLSGRILVKKTDSPDALCDAPQILGEIQQFNPSRQRTATVSGDTACVLFRFQWKDFWDAACKELRPPELEQLRKALENYAWEHFMN